MAKVRIALATFDLGPRHSDGSVAGLNYVFLGDGLPKAGLAGTRFELGFRTEKCVVALTYEN